MVGVYDGHGGSFVSKYVADNIVRCLAAVPGWPETPAEGLAAAYKVLDAELYHSAPPFLDAAKAIGPRMRNPKSKIMKMGTTALTIVVSVGVDGAKQLACVITWLSLRLSAELHR